MPRGKSTSAQGKITKVSNSATEMPMVIIQPKSITGRSPLTTSDPKATAVVSVV